MKPVILGSAQLMDIILDALKRREPLPVVSLGATESFVLAQNTVLSMSEIMSHAESRVANRGIKRGQMHRGIRFPNLRARDELVIALRNIDIVGYNLTLLTKDEGLLTHKVWDYYGLWPKYTFESYIRRVIMLSQKQKFEEMLHQRKVLVICGYAGEVARALHARYGNWLGVKVVGAIPIFEFEELPQVIRQIRLYDFDLALIAAGLNAIILASHIAKVYGKVAFDLGQGMETLITGKVVDEGNYLETTIGIDRLMKM